MPKSLPPRVAEQRKKIVDAVIDALDNHDLTWLQEWSAGDAPQNFVSGNAYRGLNRLNLSFASRACGFTDPRFITFKQATERGWKVRKGERSFAVEKWKSFVIPALNEDHDARVCISCVGYYSVFNLEQVDGAPPYEPHLPDISANNITIVADRLIETSRCEVQETTEGRACYQPAYDRIIVPDRRLFIGDTDVRRSQNFIRTLTHEMVHSTMKPLDRPHRNYAREELVAELGALFTCSDLGLTVAYDTSDKHFRQHVAYLQSWSRALHDKPQALFTAAALADKASEYILNRYNS
jgi:antirestriction protein ArdC